MYNKMTKLISGITLFLYGVLLPSWASAQIEASPSADISAIKEESRAELETRKTEVDISIDNPMRLESTFVGDKEQPGVSYFIPWKGTSTPDKLHWNIENKNDKTLELIDRDVILRSTNIYNEMNLEKPDE